MIRTFVSELETGQHREGFEILSGPRSPPAQLA